MKKYLQDCQTIEDFELLSKNVTNMVEAEYIIRTAARVLSKDRVWMRQFCESNFSRFKNSDIYNILLGGLIGDKSDYHYVPNPF